MNRFLLLATAFTCVSVIASTNVQAQGTTSSTPATTTATTQVTTPPKRTFVTEPTLQKIAQTRLTNLAANMSNRMDSAVKRLQNVTDRLNSRLIKMESEGKNISAAKTELENATRALAEAKDNLATIDMEVNAFIGSATPRENWQNVKNTYAVTRASIISAHTSILKTIELAKSAGVVPAPEAATSTASTTNN